MSGYLLFLLIVAVSIVITHWLKQATNVIFRNVRTRNREMRELARARMEVDVVTAVEDGNMRAYYRQMTDPLNPHNYFQRGRCHHD
jgi:hypothetical protein